MLYRLAVASRAAHGSQRIAPNVQQVGIDPLLQNISGMRPKDGEQEQRFYWREVECENIEYRQSHVAKVAMVED
jgi:hypothetical protein